MEIITLNWEDYKKLLDLVADSPAPSPALIDAFVKYGEMFPEWNSAKDDEAYGDLQDMVDNLKQGLQDIKNGKVQYSGRFNEEELLDGLDLKDY